MDQQIDDSFDGQEVMMPVGQQFEVCLRENPTTGFRWHLTCSGAPVCEQISDSHEAKPGPPGQGGIQCWQFRTAQPGLGYVELSYYRSWEPTKGARTFAVRVRVRE